jgi:hypothetical protein
VIALSAIAAIQLAVIGLLVVERRKASADMIALVDRLCQRVQAPAAAVLEHDEATRLRHPEEYAPPAVEPDDDDGYWLSRGSSRSTMKAEADGSGHWTHRPS